MSPARADMFDHSFAFPEPEVHSVRLVVERGGPALTFEQVTIEGLPSNGHPGAPVLPLQPVRLLLPQGTVLDRVEIVTDPVRPLEGVYRLPPSQRPHVLSRPEERTPTPPDPKIYGAGGVYPKQVRSEPVIQWCRGYQILYLNLFPLRYEPVHQKLYYTPRMTVRVFTKPGHASSDIMRCRGLLQDRAWVKGAVQNPDLAAAYRSSRAPLGPSGKNGPSMKTGPNLPEPNPYVGSHHPYVIITSEELAADPGPNNFQALLDHRRARGLPGMIKTVEEIYEKFDGQDEQEKIRNFCRHAYSQWGAQYILLGGDGNAVNPGCIIPARGMWVTGEGYIEKNLKSDLYYSNLDGSFNENGNSKWGELDDGLDGGDVDLLSELFVGRAPVQNGDELHRFVAKTIAYENDDYTESWYTRGHFVGEFLWSGPSTYGGTYMDELIHGCSLWGYTTTGYPQAWNKTTLYEKNGGWWPSTLINTLNSNEVHHVNHLGHANAYMVMKLGPQDIQNLNNTRYFFAYSQGCIAGAIASGHSVGEQFTIAEGGAFGVIMNDKYGWGEVGCTDGSSQYLHRQFVDALFGEGIVEAGAANADSKEDNIWCINYKTNRWCAYETNLFGDPATPLVGPLLTSKGLLNLDRSAYPDGGKVAMTLKDLDLNQSAMVRDEVLLSVTASGGDQEEVKLIETGLNTAVFTGHLVVAEAGPAQGNGLLELSHDEAFDVVYVDGDDGFGGTHVEVKAQAEADFVFPTVSGVQVAFVDDSRVKITWDSDEPTAGTLVYGMETPPMQTAFNDQLLDPGFVEAEGLLQCSNFFFYLIAADAAGNETVEDNGGGYYTFLTKQRYYPLREDLNQDPSWSISAGSSWAFGQPLGNNGDPDRGHTGPFVYGYNLDGPYEDNLSAKHLTTPPLDCSGLTGVSLDFWRLLPVWGSPGDNAVLSVSADGSTWTEIYHNPISPYIEPCWLRYAYDLSQIADGQPTVFVRFTMGPTNDSVNHGGWNLDDLTLSGVAAPSQPWLEYEGHVIDDGAGGNGNGMIEPKEQIQLPLTLFNSGLDSTAPKAVLTTFSPYVTVMNGTTDFPDAAHNQKVSSLDPHLSFSVSEEVEDGDEIVFGVDWTADGHEGSFTLIQAVECPRVVFADAELDDSSGDGDGCLDPGETVTLVLSLKNEGSLPAFNVACHLESSHPQYITIQDGDGTFGDIEVGETVTSFSPHFTFTADPLTPNYTEVTFTASIVADNFEDDDFFDVEVTDCNLQYVWPLDVDPGWTMEGDWAFGVPQGKLPPKVGAGCPDPTAGFTGENVLGYNLLGSYSMGMNEKYLTSLPIDCSSLEAVKVRFKRWLGVGSAKHDHAAFQASNDGVTWVTVWEHTATQPISDGAWVHVEYEISNLADHQPTVYLRWVMGPTSFILFYCGWNIDDIELWGR
jgi:hypothetical protein